MSRQDIADRVADRALDRPLTAAEMERHCPDCAEQIRRGELEVTWGELREVLEEHYGKTGD